VHFKLVAKGARLGTGDGAMSKGEEIEAEIMGRVEARLEQALGDDETLGRMTLTEIEEAGLAVGAETGKAVTAGLVSASGSMRERKRLTCPECGQVMRDKGYRYKEVIARTGEVRVRRAYYYCEGCRKGFFSWIETGV
jgi:hypothetical protein